MTLELAFRPCHDTGVATKQAAAKRARGVPVQVYLSPAEAKAVRAIASKRELTVAQLFRRWIRRAMPRPKVRPRKDARQLAWTE
jgi:hypothetical protein